MPIVRNVDDYQGSGDFEKVYIPQGAYLGRIIEVKDSDKNGVRLKKDYKDNKTGEMKSRDAIIVVCRLEDVINGGPECKAVVGQTMGKKLTDSLNEKAALYKWWRVIFGTPPTGMVDYEAMLGKQVVVEVVDSSAYNPQGELVQKSYIEGISRFYGPNAFGPAIGQALTAQAAAPTQPQDNFTNPNDLAAVPF